MWTDKGLSYLILYTAYTKDTTKCEKHFIQHFPDHTFTASRCEWLNPWNHIDKMSRFFQHNSCFCIFVHHSHQLWFHFSHNTSGETTTWAVNHSRWKWNHTWAHPKCCLPSMPIKHTDKLYIDIFILQMHEKDTHTPKEGHVLSMFFLEHADYIS